MGSTKERWWSPNHRLQCGTQRSTYWQVEQSEQRPCHGKLGHPHDANYSKSSHTGLFFIPRADEIHTLVFLQKPSFRDEKVQAGKEYEYRVAAINEGGESEPSDASKPIKAKPLKRRLTLTFINHNSSLQHAIL